MGKTFRNLLAISVAVLPINIIMIWHRLSQSDGFSTSDMILYPLLFGTGSIILILLLNKYLIRDSFITTFNSRPEHLSFDLLVGLILAAVYFIMMYLERVTIYNWLPNGNAPNEELVNAMQDMADKPLLLIIWFGPVLWIGIALFEELSRVFLLKCLWNINSNRLWHITVIFISSLLIGFVHLHLGTAGVISIGLKSLVACFYFYKFRRLLPLVIAHALYDGIQFAMFLYYLN